MEDLTFADEINRPVINIPRAALAVSRAVAFPSLDVNGYLTRLDKLAENARPHLESCSTLEDRVDALSEFLFDQARFRGNRTDYHDPMNSHLNRVLDRKQGIPITLSVIYVAVAQRLGLPAYGIGLPGHFIVGVYQNGTEILIDPFNAGLRLSHTDCARLVKESSGYQGPFQAKWLHPVAPVDLLARMLTNLCNAYVQREDWQAAIPVIQHLLTLQPEREFHLRDLGYLYLYNGSMRLSAQYLEEYLRRAPSAPDFDHVKSSLEIVAGRLALWN